jgi:hypothetical protein
MKLLDTLEKEVNETRKLSHKKKLVDYFDGINNNFLSEANLTDIKNKITNFFTNLKNIIINKGFDEGIALSTTFSDLVIEINDNCLGNELLNKINQTYSNEIDKMLTKYYSVVNPAFEKFNTTFFDKNYQIHKSQYAVKPTELS